MIIQEAAEMYLETILILKKRRGWVRSIDIVNEMGYSKPTVSAQMKKFRENGFIKMDRNGAITLTDEGCKIAERTLERHHMIAQILMKLGVDEETANQDACRIEHYISQKTFDCLKEYFEKK